MVQPLSSKAGSSPPSREPAVAADDAMTVQVVAATPAAGDLNKPGDRPAFFTRSINFEQYLLLELTALDGEFSASLWRGQWGDAMAAGKFLSRVEKLLVEVSSQDVVVPTLYDEWQATCARMGMRQRAMRGYEMLLARAKKHGLTLRDRPPAYVAIPRDQLAAGIDPARVVVLDKPEQYGELHVAAAFVDRMLRGQDVWCLCDTDAFADDTYGAGKTTVATRVGIEVAARLRALQVSGYLDLEGLHLPPFDVRHDVIYADDAPRFDNALSDTSFYRVRVPDEGAEWFYLRDGASTNQKRRLKRIKRKRKQRQCWLIPMDNIFRSDRDMWRLKYTHRIKIYEPGRAGLYRKGGIPDEPEDRWGRHMFDFEFGLLPDELYATYLQCNLLLEAADIDDRTKVSPLDRRLDDDPQFAIDAILTNKRPQYRGDAQVRQVS